MPCRCIGTNAVVSVADISGDMNHVYRVSIVDTPPHGTADSASEVNDTTTTGHTSREESIGPTEASSANGTEMGKRSFSVIVKMAPRDVLVCEDYTFEWHVICMSMCMHVHVHACLCAHVHACPCTCMSMCMYVSMCMYMCLCACTCVYVHVCVHVHACPCTYMSMCMYVSMCMHVSMCMYNMYSF